MIIEWKLNNSEKINFEELLGCIKIMDEIGNTIEEDCIYLDTFFFAISESLTLAIKEGMHKIDTIDESAYLIATRNGKNFSLEYENQKICTTYKEAVSGLIDAYNQLRREVGKCWVSEQCPELENNVSSLSNEKL